MTWILVIVVVVVLAGVLLVAVKAKSGAGSGEGEWPFYSRKPLSVPEQVLYFRLIEVLPEYIVLAQVQLSRFLGVKKGNNYQAWANRINRMSADFVVCARDASVVAVIELDDSSHVRAKRQIADAKKDEAIRSAGIRILRWHARSLPDAAAIKAEFGRVQKIVPGDTPAAASLRQGRG